jgi:hypothetical protein
MWKSWLCLLLAWLAVTFCGGVRLEGKGAFATDESAGFFRYCENKYHSDPGCLRLNQPYSWWAAQMPGTDARNYICAALGLFEGKGLAIKEVTLQQLNSQKYVPYYYQVPGTPLAIWLVMRIFGGQSVFPYFCFIALMHLFTASGVCVLARFYFNREFYVLVQVFSAYAACRS